MELITVGEFSRLTHLTVKALHHYHHVGLLEPASVDSSSGYRLYRPAQLEQAYLIKRLRDVGMPVPQVAAVLAAPSEAVRDQEIASHLAQLRSQLEATAAAVSSLEALLAGGPGARVRLWDAPAELCFTRTAFLARPEIEAWLAETYPRLYAEAARHAVAPSGPGGALYGPGWFEEGEGEVTAFVPSPAGDGTLGAQRYAVVRHAGPYAELDRTYGALGGSVPEAGVEAPIRENYLISPADTADPAAWRTDVCWPVPS